MGNLTYLPGSPIVLFLDGCISKLCYNRPRPGKAPLSSTVTTFNIFLVMQHHLLDIHVYLGIITLSRAICLSVMGTQIAVLKFLKPFLMVISVSGCPLSHLFVVRVPHDSTLTST